MEGSRKIKITVSFVLALILVTVGIVFSIINSNKAKQEEKDVVLGQTDMSNVPYIVSVPPVVGYIGIEYVYDIKYSDRDSKAEEIKVSLENAPTWLSVEGLHIYGLPPVGSSGQYKFNVRISDELIPPFKKIIC
jgi:H+/Cl- antiporter ClcA